MDFSSQKCWNNIVKYNFNGYIIHTTVRTNDNNIYEDTHNTCKEIAR